MLDSISVKAFDQSVRHTYLNDESIFCTLMRVFHSAQRVTSGTRLYVNNDSSLK
jgi:hypothetical protein